ncbi:MAG: FAD synthetase family protein [Clostridia bacterium]|nr:FAD synthetase family protein [Clostridia bacterium]
MKVFRTEQSYDLGSCVVALGTFDGVHIGHQALIRRAMELAKEMDAKCVVCTFDRHPLTLLCPERAPVPLMSMEEKLQKLEQMGVDGVLVREFTPEFAGIEPARYLADLSRDLQVKGVVAGFNYSFGAGGRGNADLIISSAEKLGYRAEIVEAVLDGEDTVSSTLIRNLLANGEEERAQRLMQLRSVKL